MKKLFDYANWKTILPLFILLIGFIVYAFPKYQNQINSLTGEKLTSLDARMHYTKEEVILLFNKMGTEGRNIYRFISSRIDMAYPVVYGLFFILVLASLLKNFIPSTSLWKWLLVLPVIGVTFDYLENVSVLKLLATFPEITNTQVAFASQMTSLKWYFLYASLIVILFLTLIGVIRFFRKKPGK